MSISDKNYLPKSLFQNCISLRKLRTHCSHPTAPRPRLYPEDYPFYLEICSHLTPQVNTDSNSNEKSTLNYQEYFNILHTSERETYCCHVFNEFNNDF